MNKIYFQGTFGAYSHLAALSIYPKSEMKAGIVEFDLKTKDINLQFLWTLFLQD